MTVALIAPFVLAAVFASVARRELRDVDPRRATWAVTVGSVVLTACGVSSLALIGWPLVARIPVVATLGDWRAGAVGHGVPIPVGVSALALVGLCWIGTRVVPSGLSFARQLSALTPSDSHEATLTVLEDDAPAAYSVPGIVGRQGRTIVSTGLLELLDDDERAAVLAHEQAHVDCGHHWFALALRLSCTANPLLGGVDAIGLHLIERWADERAAARTDRRTAARAIARSALARIAVGSTSAVVLHVAAGPVSERVRALLVEPPAASRRQWAVMLVAAVGLAAIGVACHDMEGLFEALRRFG